MITDIKTQKNLLFTIKPATSAYRLIIEELATGKTMCELARKYKCSPSSICLYGSPRKEGRGNDPGEEFYCFSTTEGRRQKDVRHEKEDTYMAVALFHAIVDVSCYNELVLCTEVDLNWMRNKLYKRRIFLEQLGMVLVE